MNIAKHGGNLKPVDTIFSFSLQKAQVFTYFGEMCDEHLHIINAPSQALMWFVAKRFLLINASDYSTKPKHTTIHTDCHEHDLTTQQWQAFTKQQIKRVKYMLILPRMTDELEIRAEMKRCNSFSPTHTPSSSSEPWIGLDNGHAWDTKTGGVQALVPGTQTPFIQSTFHHGNKRCRAKMPDTLAHHKGG